MLPTAQGPWPMLSMLILDPNHPDSTCSSWLILDMTPNTRPRRPRQRPTDQSDDRGAPAFGGRDSGRPIGGRSPPQERFSRDRHRWLGTSLNENLPYPRSSMPLALVGLKHTDNWGPGAVGTCAKARRLSYARIMLEAAAINQASTRISSLVRDCVCFDAALSLARHFYNSFDIRITVLYTGFSK